MTYSSFDPSKVDVDAAASYANTTDHIIEKEELRKAEELEAKYAAMAEEEGEAAQQKKEEGEEDTSGRINFSTKLGSGAWSNSTIRTLSPSLVSSSLSTT